MEKITKTVLSNMTMVYKDDKILVMDRTKNDWPGLTFPGGHVEDGETLEQAAIREIKEETNLDIFDLELVGVIEWFFIKGVRYLGFLYRTDKFKGDIKDSPEGKIFWISRKDLGKYNLSQDFEMMCNKYFFK